MITLEAFSEGERKIIERDFVNSNIHTEGTLPSAYMETGNPERVEYGALLRHPDYIAIPTEEFSMRISDIAPSLACPREDVHTGLVQYRGDEDKDIVLKKLKEATYKALGSLKSPRMTYERWYYNQDTVIVAGEINEAFVDIMNGIMSNYEGDGLRIKWGAQITANRFTEKRSPEELQEFFKLMKRAPELGLSRPTILDVISQTISRYGSTIEIYARFRISP